MKIDCIFDERLYAFRYPKVKYNEYRRLLKLWNDTEYLFSFYEENKKYFQDQYFPYDFCVEDLVEGIENDLEFLEKSLEKIEKDKTQKLDNYFEALSPNGEQNGISLSLHKKRFKFIRLYAIQIDEDVFVITGGAIKITKKMQDHPQTKDELAKLDYAKQYLKNERVVSNESFHEFIENNNYDNK